MAVFFSPLTAFADSAPGDVIVTLGNDLTKEQQTALLAEMGESEKSTVVKVTNQEEHQYLARYISKAQIGTRALSSSKITVGEEGSGLKVKTHNINWVTNEMYVNALTTAGVKNADVYVTAPFPVSGTAGLTGIIKAYEASSGVSIPEAQKQVANEEMVKTGQLADSHGKEDAAKLISAIKEEFAKQQPKTDEEINVLIHEVSNQVNINLTESEVNGLVELFKRMRDANIDWVALGDGLNQAKAQVDEFMNREETKSFVSSLSEFLKMVIQTIADVFR
ncbi:DUF1002 domain-containing protein [Brevibacillus choshinensis]|uniref:DUF1002 domain-containing protein n=2 Tax=Brevibacillus choshinensis TaxID=54911 RepID=A0ABX7FXD3_BRECH|nr:DUF1002 domain-containing protein [Brevibacillus choshinensis]